MQVCGQLPYQASTILPCRLGHGTAATSAGFKPMHGVGQHNLARGGPQWEAVMRAGVKSCKRHNTGSSLTELGRNHLSSLYPGTATVAGVSTHVGRAFRGYKGYLEG